MLFLPIWREFIVDWCAILCNKLWRTSSQIAKCHVNFGKTSGTAKNRFALCFRQNHKVGKIKKCTKEKAYPKGYAVSESSKCNGNDRRPNGDNHRDNGDVAADDVLETPWEETGASRLGPPEGDPVFEALYNHAFHVFMIRRPIDKGQSFWDRYGTKREGQSTISAFYSVRKSPPILFQKAGIFFIFWVK